jgi:hypothetical protein
MDIIMATDHVWISVIPLVILQHHRSVHPGITGHQTTPHTLKILEPEVTISPLGGLRATYYTLRWRQGRGNTFPGSKCVGLSDSTHKDHWIISKEVTPRANPMLSKENVESSICEWEHSRKQAMEHYNSICHTGWSTPLLSSTLVHTRLTADRQKTSAEAPSTIEGTEVPLQRNPQMSHQFSWKIEAGPPPG